jgi:hypothetical protein
LRVNIMLRRIFGTPEYLAEIEERSRARIRQADAAHKKHEQNKKVFDEIAEKVLNPEIKSKWQERIRQAINYFEDKKVDTALSDYFMQRDIDPLRNIDVIYLMLAMAHDDHLQLNFIITHELKKMNPELFCWGNYIFYCREGRLPLFWEHIKRDLNTGIDLASTKPSETKQNASSWKNCISNFFWTLYEKTLKIVVDAVMEKVWPK